MGEENNEKKDATDLDGRQWNQDVEEEVDDAIIAELNEEEAKKEKKGDEDSDEDDDNDEDSTDEDEEDSEDKDDSEDSEEEDRKDDEDDEDEEDDSDSDDDEEDDNSIIEERAKKIAEKYDIDIEEATEVAKVDKEIADKYESDPLQLAHELGSTSGKLDSINQQMLERQKELSNPYLFGSDKVTITNPKDGKKTEMSKEDFVKEYKDKEKDDKELQEMSDDEVFREAKRRNKDWLDDRFAKAREKVQKDAARVREDILKDIPENVKKYEKQIKTLVENFPDESLVSKGFDKKLPAKLVMAEHIDDIVKDAEKVAYEKGRKNLKVIKKHEDSPSKKGKGKSVKSKNKYQSLLSKSQQEQALEDYEEDKISDEKKYQYYYESMVKK